MLAKRCCFTASSRRNRLLFCQSQPFVEIKANARDKTMSNSANPDPTAGASSDAFLTGARRDWPWFKRYPADVDWHQTIVPSPVSELLDQAVARFPGHVCTNFLGRTITYAEIATAVNHAAAGLQGLGVGKGTKVGLFLPNSPTFIVAYYAVLKAGGTVVNFNPLYSQDELTHQIRDSGTTLMVTLDLKVLFDKVEQLLAAEVLQRAVVASFASLLPTLKSALFRLTRGQEIANLEASGQRGKVVRQRDLMANDGRPSPVVIDPVKDIAVLQYTGGTTGTPKGAMLSHANLTANVEQISAWAGPLQDGKETVMAILPLFHVFAMSVVMNFGIRRGAQLILVPKFEINETVRLMNSVKPTILPGVPTLFNALLNNAGAQKSGLKSLKWCFSGGAGLPIPVKQKFEAMTGAILIEGYGLSETSPVATGNPPGGPIKDGSIGLPMPATYISVRSLDDPTREMPLGENGEICISGPQVMLGYWNNPAETAASFTTGQESQGTAGARYFRTGDIGHMDEDGFTFISDRMKEMINSSGFKIYPRRIEEALYQHPAVEEAAVIGVPNEHKGEAPVAFVKLREGASATAEDLMAFLRPKLAKMELPEAIEFRDKLPKTMIGKLSKKDLKAEYLARGV
jgi:long-chain acyl-CoA synthetase